MQVPVQVTFKGIPVDDALEKQCLAEALDLERFGTVMSCRVVVARPHHHQRKGNLYEIRIDLKLRGREIAVTRTPPEHAESEHADAAVRDAFARARRQLQDEVRLRRET